MLPTDTPDQIPDTAQVKYLSTAQVFGIGSVITTPLHVDASLSEIIYTGLLEITGPLLG